MMPESAVDFGFSERESINLTVSVATTFEAVEALREDYERLFRVARITSPFSTLEWHVAWCRAFLNARGRRNTQPIFHVVRDATGTCVAIFPLLRTVRRLGSIEFIAFEMLGADASITEIREPLLAPGYEIAVACALKRQLHQSFWDWVRWSGITAEFAQAISEGNDLRWQESLCTFVLDLPPSWELLHGALKRNIRESLRHCYNSLKRNGLGFTLRIATSPSAVKDGVDQFLLLHTMRANLAGTVQHANHFANAISRQFLQDVCVRLSQRNIVRVFELVIEGEVVAARIGFVLGGSLYLYYSGFNPAWAKYGVMTTTLAEIIKYAITEGLSTVNLSSGKDNSKTRWGPREVLLGQLTQVRRSPLSKAKFVIYEKASRAGTRLCCHRFLAHSVLCRRQK